MAGCMWSTAPLLNLVVHRPDADLHVNVCRTGPRIHTKKCPKLTQVPEINNQGKRLDKQFR